jgi:hypothetical protein
MLIFGIVATWAALPSVADTTNIVPQDFPHAVTFELGVGDFAPDDNITIQEVRGTMDVIQPGGTYCVTGTYTLKTQDEADLALFETVTNSTPTQVNPRQEVHVVKGTGSFHLIKHVTEDGYLHVSFYSLATGQGFGGTYFGQGQWVLRHAFSHRADVISRTPQGSDSAAGVNQALFDYLGNPVAPPENLDVAYTKGGLTHAMQTAAKNAGISLVKLEVDDSEFPCLVGVVCANRGEMEKLKDQIRTMPEYNYTGGVGGRESYAMNLVPYTVFPPGSSQRVDHRMMLREEILSDKINGVN